MNDNLILKVSKQEQVKLVDVHQKWMPHTEGMIWYIDTCIGA